MQRAIRGYQQQKRQNIVHEGRVLVWLFEPPDKMGLMDVFFKPKGAGVIVLISIRQHLSSLPINNRTMAICNDDNISYSLLYQQCSYIRSYRVLEWIEKGKNDLNIEYCLIHFKIIYFPKTVEFERFSRSRNLRTATSSDAALRGIKN